MASRNKPTYHRRLFSWLLAYSWLMVLCFAAFQYHRERRFKAEELNIRLQSLNESLLASIGQSDTVSHLGPLPPIAGLRVSVIDLQGRVLYDNTLDSLPKKSHLERQEIVDAVANGSGYALRRHSESTGQTYFYSARKGKNRIVRTAVPYSVSLRVLLRADYGFLWFMIGVTSAMSLLGYFATRRVGLHVSRLNRFAEKAERGERIFDTEPFPHDELGDISNHIVRLYAQLQQAVAARDREHRQALLAEQEKIRIKKQLTNNINHELKTPVAAMQACLETLMTHRDLPPEKRDEFIARCHANGERLKNLLADVSLITRMGRRTSERRFGAPPPDGQRRPAGLRLPQPDRQCPGLLGVPTDRDPPARIGRRHGRAVGRRRRMRRRRGASAASLRTVLPRGQGPFAAGRRNRSGALHRQERRPLARRRHHGGEPARRRAAVPFHAEKINVPCGSSTHCSPLCSPP